MSDEPINPFLPPKEEEQPTEISNDVEELKENLKEFDPEPKIDDIPQANEPPPVEADKVVDVPKPTDPIIEEAPVQEEPEYLKILREHNYLESNIGIGHKYWKIRP